MKPIAIFYHCLFYYGTPPELVDSAINVVHEQMDHLRGSGLLDAAGEFIVGINGGQESKDVANVLIPAKAKTVMHTLASRAENLTLVALEQWVKGHPDWDVLYFHAKGCTHAATSSYSDLATRWRRCMMRHTVGNWRQCVADLAAGYEAAGCHWMTGLGSDRSQNIFAGNFWWATSNFLATVPSIFKRDRIKVSGIAAVESRYEAEVWIGNGRLPKVKDYVTDHGLTGCPAK